MGTHAVLSGQVDTHVGYCFGTASALCVFPTVHWRMCAAPYAMNDAYTNVCPAGSAKITMEAMCQAAAAFLGTPYSGLTLFLSRSSRPSGCYVYTVYTLLSPSPPTVWFNPDPTGAPLLNAEPLCIVTGVPPPHTSGVPWAEYLVE